MKQRRLHGILISLSLAVILFTIGGLLHPALAHDPGGSSKIRINNEKIGPYNLLVATSPQPVTVGQMDVWVRVAEGETDRLLRDAVVRVEATPRSGGPTVTAQATHEHAGNAFDYVAHLDIEDSGQWDFIIYVEGESGQVDVTFTDAVSGGLNVFLVIALAVSLVVLAIGVGVYLWRQSVVA